MEKLKLNIGNPYNEAYKILSTTFIKNIELLIKNKNDYLG